MAYYSFLTTLFEPILLRFAEQPAIAELIVASVFIFTISLFYKVLVNNTKMGELRSEQKELQKKIKESDQNSGETKELTKKMLKLSHQQMKMNVKPMIATFGFIFLFVLPWLGNVVAFNGTVAILPFSLPFKGVEAGWLMWYVLCSFPLNQLFRKILRVM